MSTEPSPTPQDWDAADERTIMDVAWEQYRLTVTPPACGDALRSVLHAIGLDPGMRVEQLQTAQRKAEWFDELWEQYQSAEDQFGDDYFWVKHGHKDFADRIRAAAVLGETP